MKKKTGLQIKLNLYKLNYKLTETMAEMQKKQLKLYMHVGSQNDKLLTDTESKFDKIISKTYPYLLH